MARKTESKPGPRPRAGIAALLVVALASAAVLFALRPRAGAWTERDLPSEPWNVLLVSLDTTRPDYLEAAAADTPTSPGPGGAAAGSPVPSPALARIRGGGFVLSTMIAPAPITLPSHASLLTALDPPRHGVRENTEYALPADAWTLAEALREHGYRTQAFVSAFVMDGRFGLEQGFEEYVDDLTASGVRPGAVEIPGGVVAERAGDWISRYAAARRSGTETRPFFLFVHLFDAHAPYAPPSPYRESFAADPYAGELAYQDACLGRILDRLESEGEAARTLIWVVSDHGESLGAHGEDTHSLFVYDVTQRAVSILRLPPAGGRLRPGAPRGVVRDVTGLVDVFPTILDLLALGDAGAPPQDGRSLLPLLRGGSDPERAIYCETLSPYISYRWSPLHAVRTREWKYIRAPYPELYDLANDPNEERNLAGAMPDRVRELSLRLDAFLQGEAVGADAAREPDEEELARLRSLGYLSGRSDRAGDGAASADRGDLPDPKRQIAFFRDSFQNAKTLLHAGRVEDAIARFRTARDIDPGNPSIHLFLGAAERQAGDLQNAAASYRTALSLQPGSSRAWAGLGRTLLLQSDPDSARWAFEEARRLLPASPDPWEGLGDVAWRQGDLARAAALLDSARTLGSPPVLIEGKLARLYRDGLGDAQRARAHLEAFARALGTTPEVAAARLPEAP